MAKLRDAKETVMRRLKVYMADTSGIPRRLKVKPDKWKLPRSKAPGQAGRGFVKTGNLPGNKELRRAIVGNKGIPGGPLTAKGPAGAATAKEGVKGFLNSSAAKGLGVGLMAYLVASELLTHREKMQQMNLQEQALTNVNPQDQFYAAALPELQAERQQAQAALFQTILGGQGMPIPVPGERQIGY